MANTDRSTFNLPTNMPWASKQYTGIHRLLREAVLFLPTNHGLFHNTVQIMQDTYTHTLGTHLEILEVQRAH